LNRLLYAHPNDDIMSSSESDKDDKPDSDNDMSPAKPQPGDRTMARSTSSHQDNAATAPLAPVGGSEPLARAGRENAAEAGQAVPRTRARGHQV
jgi:hypothetical protein